VLLQLLIHTLSRLAGGVVLREQLLHQGLKLRQLHGVVVRDGLHTQISMGGGAAAHATQHAVLPPLVGCGG
jgi:hypothetical protein